MAVKQTAHGKTAHADSMELFKLANICSGCRRVSCMNCVTQEMTLIRGAFRNKSNI